MRMMHLCHFRTVPADKECLEAIWSQGRSCRTCFVTCYRRGWLKAQVDRDNKQRARCQRDAWQNQTALKGEMNGG